MNSVANSLTNVTATMSSVEIAKLVNKRHDNVKRTIETLAKRGVIQLPQIEEVNNIQSDSPNSRSGAYIFSGEQGKRDSIVVVAQLSPEFTARLVDRWQELEKQLAKPQAFHKPIGNIILIADAMGRFKLSTLRNASGESKSKRPADWLKTKYAQQWIEDLSNLSSLGQDVVTIHRSGTNLGIFAHEILAIEYAGYLSPEFQTQFKQVLEGYYSRDRTVVETNIVISVNRSLPKGIYLQNSKTNPYRAMVYAGAQKISVGCYPTVEEAVDAQNLYFDTGEVKTIKKAPVRFNSNGQYLVTVTDGKVSHYELMGDRTVVDAEAYWRLRKDLNTTQGIMTELATRMRFVHDERSIASIDYPIDEIVSH
nr:KilA-N domain-containing protein [Xenorhabdus lircayensis]